MQALMQFTGYLGCKRLQIDRADRNREITKTVHGNALHRHWWKRAAGFHNQIHTITLGLTKPLVGEVE